MEVLTLNGQKYVKASKAARDLGYASDYVGQLCRKGVVDAHLVGRTWYVNPDTLGAHRVEKKRNARVKAREHARKSIEEAKKSLHVKDDAKSYTNVAIRYEDDKKELIPEVRKITIDSYQRKVEPEPETTLEKKYSVENENEKIIMSGTLNVHDAELEEEFTDTTILTPRIVRTHRKLVPETHDIAPVVDDSDVEMAQESEIEHEHVSFIDRVTAQEEDSSDAGEESMMEEDATPTDSPIRFLIINIVAVLLIIVGVGSLFASIKLSYEAGRTSTSVQFDSESISKFIKQNIDFSDRLF